jgi:hypothetical protein
MNTLCIALPERPAAEADELQPVTGVRLWIDVCRQTPEKEN